VQGESSGSASSSFRGNRENSRYGGNQSRWNNGRGGAMANQSRGRSQMVPFVEASMPFFCSKLLRRWWRL
jgi:hypothetical protein